jgi:hypothetical protein
MRHGSLIWLAVGLACTTARGAEPRALTPADGLPVCPTAGGPSQQPAYSEFQVDEPARLLKQGRPLTPGEGRALVQVVVDTAGQPVMATFKVLQASGTSAERAAQDFIAGSTYRPALRGGCRVSQLVQRTFTF